ncbi:chaperone protein dnaJ 11, chloroplastic-like [Senna tora]|uniref:Chaperone protein dnaJ 11, chloroplastic-like n=1 Tax=Senna tora TaxID=362788 RepID=A0A834TVI2_9FABA|nr:chaperone protein dnaJ 11, chloroplastic-like [Senna tora]
MQSLSIPPSLSTTTFSTQSVSSPPYQQKSRPSSSLSSHTMSSSCTTSLYEILGIPSRASNQEIKAAYRRLARVCHPDVATVDRKNSSAVEFMKIHAAYSTLSDPEKRATYDRSLCRRQRPLSTASSYSGYSGRNWETDQCW